MTPAKSTKTRVPAVEGWFTVDGEPRLLGSRCRACGTYAFPRHTFACPNPACASTELDDVPLSARGTVWSWTTNRYQPPPPYVAPTEPFEPFSIAAVELTEERMVVMGQVQADGADLEIGTQVELVVDTLYEDEEHTYLVWKWAVIR